MKAMLLISSLFVASFANAASISFACRGNTDDGAKVYLSGTYDLTAGDYTMTSNLTISGSDGDGVSLFSSGGGGGTERFFEQDNVTLGSSRGYFNLTAKSSNGSLVKIRHKEGSAGEDYVLIDLQPTRTKGAYWHEFNFAKCRFQ